MGNGFLFKAAASLRHRQRSSGGGLVWDAVQTDGVAVDTRANVQYMMAAENGGSQQAGAVGVAAPYTYADGPLAGAQCALGRQATGPPVLLGPSLSLCLVLRASAVSIPSSAPPEKPAIPPRLASCHPPFSCSPTISSAQSSGLLRLNFDTCTRDQITATSNFIFERPCS